MSYIKWFNIYCNPWFDAEVVAKIFRVELVGDDSENKMQNNRFLIDEYTHDNPFYFNLDCFNRVLDTSKREDIHEFKERVQNYEYMCNRTRHFRKD